MKGFVKHTYAETQVDLRFKQSKHPESHLKHFRHTSEIKTNKVIR